MGKYCSCYCFFMQSITTLCNEMHTAFVLFVLMQNTNDFFAQTQFSKTS